MIFSLGARQGNAASFQHFRDLLRYVMFKKLGLES